MRLKAYLNWLFLFSSLFFSQISFGQKNLSSSVEDFTITISFAQPPVDPIVFKAPLKYNKDFALILQMDNGNVAAFSQVMPFFKGQNGNPGLFFSDGAQGNVPFKLDASHFSFNEAGTDVHSTQAGYLTWSNLETLWAAEFGIDNQGLNAVPTSDNTLEVLRNISYTRRKTSETIIASGANMNVFVVPTGGDAQIPLAKQNNLAVYHQGASAIVNPARVEDMPAIQGVELTRNAISSSLFSQVQQVSANSGPNNHYIATYYNRGFSDPDISFDAFKSQMNLIASAFGVGGTDKIWSASGTEVFEYLRIRELVTVNSVIDGNNLILTFSGNGIPDDFRYYSLSVVVQGQSNITELAVQQPDGISTYKYNGSNALINMRWNGIADVDDLVRATSYVENAEQNPGIATGLIAMDYVKMLPDGTDKELLRSRLCAIGGNVYDPGFCALTDFLGPDQEICLGDTLILEAPLSEAYLWSTGETTQSIEYIPDTTADVWLRITDAFNIVSSDTMTVTVNPLPETGISPSSVIIGPGEEVTLTASGAESYLWSDGSSEATLTINPTMSTVYWVEGSNANGCKSRAEASVEVIFINEIDFIFNTVCFGDSTHLYSVINSNEPIIAKEWDLDGDGVFGDDTGDTLHLLFETPGEKLIGFRIKTNSGAIVVKYHSVPVADYPLISFEYSGTCEGETVNFTDKSTVNVGTLVSWNWEFGDGTGSVERNPINFYQLPGSYNVGLVVESSYGCSDILTRNINIISQVVADIRLANGTSVTNNSEQTIYTDDSLVVQAIGVYDSVIWVNSIYSPSLTIFYAGSYYVDVFRDGCGSRLSFTVVQGDKPKPTTSGIMNLITPNNDGYNDAWLIDSQLVTAPVKVAVYNRLGNLVFQSNDYQNDWTGKYNGNHLPEGTYYYVIEGAGGEIFKGPVSILR